MSEYPKRGGHPLQPIALDQYGAARFKKNTIVEFLLRKGPFDLNNLSVKRFPDEDWEQFAQLIGYSVSGFNDLSYASDEACEEANAAAEKLLS